MPDELPDNYQEAAEIISSGLVDLQKQGGTLTDGLPMFDKLCRTLNLAAEALSIAFTYRAEANFLRGNIEFALSDFYKAIESDPTNAWAFAFRGKAYQSIKEYPGARDHAGNNETDHRRNP
jgi:tetratricopeptide (TPR) repeat protein